MEIRFARECEKDNIMEIWDYCFNDGPKFTDYYFNNKYKNYNTIVVEEEAEIVSSLQLNQYRIQLNNQIYNTSYVVGVSTLPEARGRGYMKYMMEFMLNELYKKNQLISILMPIDYRLYRKYGYEHLFYQHKFYIPIFLFATLGMGKRNIYLQYVSLSLIYSVKLAPHLGQKLTGIYSSTGRLLVVCFTTKATILS